MLRRATAVLVLAGAVAAALAALLAIGGGEDPPGPAGDRARAVERGPQGGGDPPRPRRPAFELEVPDGAHPVVWVRKGRKVPLHAEPGGERVARLGKRTEFGSPTVLGVVGQRGRWAGVTTPKLANGRIGWVELDPRRLRYGWTRKAIVVDLSARRAELRDGERVVRSFPVTVGAPDSPTPTGRFAVTDTFRGDLHRAYGCCALAISANQPHLPSGWLGGNRIAIHGTGGALGEAVSHGCVRARDADVNALVNRVPLGTPVLIRG